MEAWRSACQTGASSFPARLLAREMFSAEERAQMDEDYESWKNSDEAANALIAEKAKSGVKGAVKSMLQ